MKRNSLHIGNERVTHTRWYLYRHFRYVVINHMYIYVVFKFLHCFQNRFDNILVFLYNTQVSRK